MRILYTVAIGLSAALLFLVQPMIGKMILPSLGGSALVWNTCMLFFQAALLAGYAYAHLLARWVPARFQIAAHAPLLLLALLWLPPAIGGAAPAAETAPAVWLLATLAAGVGLPFLALSTTGPLLQRWFAWTGDVDASDPYFLYAVSNVGSLAALLGYPFLVEPYFRLSAPPVSQALLWSIGVAAFVALTAACGIALFFRHRSGAPPPAPGPAPARAASGAAPDARRRALWVLLAFVPSSAMLGATQFLTTDLAAVPLLWILPLAAYLLTYILSFVRRPPIPLGLSSAALAVLAVAVMAAFGLRGIVPLESLVVLHLLALIAVGLVCHGRLAIDRPPAEYLTQYYLLLGLGGALGGVWSAILAPLIFESLVDYPLTLLVACFLRPPSPREPRYPERARWLDAAVPAAIAVVAAGLVFARSAPSPQSALLGAAIPAALVLATLARPVRFGLGVVVLFAAAWLPASTRGDTLLQTRTFFGVHRVTRYDPPPLPMPPGGPTPPQLPAFHNLYHGTTKHGAQIVHERLRRVPTLYFHPDGPIGAVFRGVQDDEPLRAAIIGLGAGTLAAYGQPGQSFTFFEIDPEVVRIAGDTRYFTYLSDCRASVETILGDGRLSIAGAPDGAYGLVVLDAFSSDALPVHLITREAVEVYFRKLRPNGLLALNLTNSYVNLEPVVEAIAAELGLRALVWRDDAPLNLRQLLEGKVPSAWAVMARDPARLSALGFPAEAKPLPREPGRRPEPRFLWTDDYSNLIAVLRAR